MNVLAITCHPDDMEINCGGTLLKCVKRGDHVTVCHVCNGNMGHVVIEPEELREIRIAEAARSCAMGGFDVVTCDVGDLDLYEGSKAVRDKLVQIIRKAKPDLILTHDPNDYMADHVAVARLVFDASFAASVPHYEPGEYPACEVTPLYYVENSAGINFIPTEYVDVTEETELKLKMLACHESQIKWLMDHDNVDVIEQAKVISRFRGMQCGAVYAEGFRPCLADHKLTTKRLLP